MNKMETGVQFLSVQILFSLTLSFFLGETVVVQEDFFRNITIFQVFGINLYSFYPTGNLSRISRRANTIQRSSIGVIQIDEIKKMAESEMNGENKGRSEGNICIDEGRLRRSKLEK